MTPLTKRVQRRCVVTRDAGRLLVVSLEPGDEITVRLEHGKRKWRLPLIAVYHLAVKVELGLKQTARRNRN